MFISSKNLLMDTRYTSYQGMRHLQKPRQQISNPPNHILQAMLLFFERNGVQQAQVVIMTANMCQADWEYGIQMDPLLFTFA